MQAPDGRNLYDPQRMAELVFEYYSVGRAPDGFKGATEEPA